MANLTIQDLPDAALPLVGTDKFIVSRNGTTLNDTPLSNLPVSTAVQTALDAKQSTSAKNQANGYLGLDASGNATANVTLRSGLTSSLMSLTAPRGELAVGLTAGGVPEAIVQFGTTNTDNKVYSPVPINTFSTTSPSMQLDSRNGVVSLNQGYLIKNYTTSSQTYSFGFSKAGLDGDLLTGIGDGAANISIAAQSATNGSGGYLELMGGDSEESGESTVVIKPSYNNFYGFLMTGQVSADFSVKTTKLGFFDKAANTTPTLQPTATGGGTKVKVADAPNPNDVTIIFVGSLTAGSNVISGIDFDGLSEASLQILPGMKVESFDQSGLLAQRNLTVLSTDPMAGTVTLTCSEGTSYATSFVTSNEIIKIYTKEDNSVDDNDTFTGGIGTSGYTIGQVVRALKLLGLIAE
jgi:hypothetical protein